MATVDDLAADVVAWTSTSATVVPTATAVECVNAAIRRLVRKHAWRYQQASVDLSFGPGAQAVAALPADFLAELAVWQKADPPPDDPSTGLAPIQRTLKPFWFAAVDPSSQRDPVFPQTQRPDALARPPDRHYYVWAGTLALVPAPSATLLVQLDYVRVLDDLVGALTPAQTNAFTTAFPDVVRNGALAEAYRFLHEFDVAALYEALFQQGREEAIAQDNTSAAAGLSKTRGT